MPHSVLITGGRVLTPFDEHPAADVLIRDGKIDAVGSNLAAPDDAERIDATGLIVSPGFIDLHTQGGGGFDVWDGTREALQTWSRTNARAGVTSFLITTGYKTSGYDYMAAHIDEASSAAEALGVYLESPFCSHARRGGISEERVGPVSIAMLDEIHDTLDDHLRMMTVAPERDGALEVIAEMRKRGIIAAMGHTDCTYDQAARAVEAGVTHVTHCFNTMRPLHHREPGPLAVALTDDRVDIEVILDGIHIHPAVIRMAVRAKGVDLTSVVTDNMRVAGWENAPSSFERMGRKLTIEGGVPRLADGTIAGSTLTMNKALQNVIAFTELSLKEALPMLTASPARAAGVGDRKGRLQKGFDADVVIFDDDFAVRRTIACGRTVHRSDAD